MKLDFKLFYLIAGIVMVAFYSYSAWYGRAFWESGVSKNTEYKGGSRIIHRNYGSGFNHK